MAVKHTPLTKDEIISIIGEENYPNLGQTFTNQISYQYYLSFPEVNQRKVGKANNLQERMTTLCKEWGPIDLANSWYTVHRYDTVVKEEKSLHRQLKTYKIPEDIIGHADGYTEMFRTSVDEALQNFLDKNTIYHFDESYDIVNKTAKVSEKYVPNEMTYLSFFIDKKKADSFCSTYSKKTSNDKLLDAVKNYSKHCKLSKVDITIETYKKSQNEEIVGMPLSKVSETELINSFPKILKTKVEKGYINTGTAIKYLIDFAVT